MYPMKPGGSRTSEGEPGPCDCMMHALDNIDHAVRGQLDQTPRVGVGSLDGTVRRSHEDKDRRTPERDRPALVVVDL